MQILQGLLTLIFGLLRFVGLFLSQIPGTKHLLKWLPWHTDEDFEPAQNDWKKGRIVYNELMHDFRTSDYAINNARRSHRTLARRLIDESVIYTHQHYKQPSHVTMRIKINGELVY